MRITGTILLILFITFADSLTTSAQTVRQADNSYTMTIPQVTAMGGSPAHLYIYSKNDGLIVFRALKDSLQWLYTTSKIKQSVNTIHADARFAYLAGDSLNMTIVNPTRFDKIFPTIELPSSPHGTVRWKGSLYIALGNDGLGKLNLNTIRSKSPNIAKVKPSLFKGQPIVDIEASNQQIFVLTGNHTLYKFDKAENGVSFKKKFHLPYHIDKIFGLHDTLIGSNSSSGIFKIHPNGYLQRIGSIGEPVLQISPWKDRLIVRGKSHRLWISDKNGKLHLWKADAKAGNYFAISRGQLWLCQYNKISRINKINIKSIQNISGNIPPKAKIMGFGKVLKIQPIKNQVVPYPHPLLIPIRLKTSLPVKNIQLHLKTSAAGAKLRGQSLYWKPKYSNAGKKYHFEIIAKTDRGETASTRFEVSVEAFNAPPNFVPVKPVAIPSGHWYHFKIKAKDPDGSNKHLVRYLGVNLPRGASVDSKTGSFRWKPGKKQVGKHEFRIIATDQYGAAAYENITIRVLGNNSK